MLEGPRGQNLELPDFRNRFWDPFKVDIRTFGDMIKDIFIKVCDLTFTVEVSAKTCGRDFKILVSSYPLIDSMCDDDPSSRPTAAQAPRAVEQANQRAIDVVTSDSHSRHPRPT